MAFVALTGPAFAAAKDVPPLPADVIARVEKVVAAQMAEGHIPGLSIAISTDGQLRWEDAYGLADLENSVPAKAETTYRYASIKKAITAVAIMQLVEAGRLDLDVPVQTYVPSFPRKQWPVNTRHVLGHVAGLRGYEGEEQDSTKHYTKVIDTLAIFQDSPLLSEPGTKYLYSSYGYVLLEAIIEGASGQSWHEYLTEHIFRPAGMVRSRPDDVHAIIPDRTQGYRRLEGGDLVNSNLADTSNKGGLVGTVGDLIRFANAFLEGRLVKPATVADMFVVADASRRKNKVGNEIAYAKGWNTMTRAGSTEKEIFHAGNQQRVTGLLYIRPDKKVVVAMLCNLEHAPLTVNMARRISEIVLGEGQPSS
jgi:CubicO group peptidase (beta-lactamase class C family)